MKIPFNEYNKKNQYLILKTIQTIHNIYIYCKKSIRFESIALCIFNFISVVGKSPPLGKF